MASQKRAAAREWKWRGEGTPNLKSFPICAFGRGPFPTAFCQQSFSGFVPRLPREAERHLVFFYRHVTVHPFSTPPPPRQNLLLGSTLRDSSQLTLTAPPRHSCWARALSPLALPHQPPAPTERGSGCGQTKGRGRSNEGWGGMEGMLAAALLSVGESLSDPLVSHEEEGEEEAAEEDTTTSATLSPVSPGSSFRTLSSRHSSRRVKRQPSAPLSPRFVRHFSIPHPRASSHLSLLLSTPRANSPVPRSSLFFWEGRGGARHHDSGREGRKRRGTLCERSVNSRAWQGRSQGISTAANSLYAFFYTRARRKGRGGGGRKGALL